jgi:PAS domain S-box-containing protein
VASTAARAYLCAGLLLIGFYVIVGGSHVIYESFGLASGVAIACGVRLHKPRARAAWLLLAAAQATLGLGDVVYFNAYGNSPPYPSAADALYLAGIVMCGVALIAIVARSDRERDLLSYLDALVVALAIGLLAWAALFSGALGSGSDLARVVSVTYPLLEVGLLAALLRVYFVRGVRTTSYYALVASVLLLILSDTWYIVPALTQSYVAGSWRDAGWLGSYLLAGYAALHPSMATFVLPKARVMNVRRVILLGLAVVSVALSAILQETLIGAVNVYVLGAAGGVAALFVVIRVAGLIRVLEQTINLATESERRFRLVFERSPIGISVGRDGIMSETNPALQRMLGYTGEELSQMHYSEITDPDHEWQKVQQELDERGRDNFAIDKRYVRKDGSILETHVNVALDLEDGLGISLVADVAERVALEEQLRQAQKMEAVGKLAGGIAHDFNNLMTAVIGYSDLLLLQLDGDDSRRLKVDVIRDSAVRASDLTRQLLAFGRRQTLQVEEVDLRGVVERMDSLLRSLIGEDILLETTFGSEEIVVRADRAQLEQVVMNLAVNARDAMPAGGTLSIAASSDDDIAILSVADDGLGMDAETLGRIYEPFFTTKAVGEGSGLGLSTVHGIVGQSGGSIEAESAPGVGTSFTIRLPLASGTAVLPEGPLAATLID